MFRFLLNNKCVHIRSNNENALIHCTFVLISFHILFYDTFNTQIGFNWQQHHFNSALRHSMENACFNILLDQHFSYLEVSVFHFRGFTRHKTQVYVCDIRHLMQVLYIRLLV